MLCLLIFITLKRYLNTFIECSKTVRCKYISTVLLAVNYVKVGNDKS